MWHGVLSDTSNTQSTKLFALLLAHTKDLMFWNRHFFSGYMIFKYIIYTFIYIHDYIFVKINLLRYLDECP